VTTDDLLTVVAYGLIAAASPLALAATLAVLGTRAPRLNGVVFAIAFLLGGALVVGFVIAIGSIAAPGRGGSSTAASSLELVLGLLLLAAGLRARRRPATELAPSEARTRSRASALLERLGRINAKTALGAGVLLGIGGPKRLTVSIVTATAIAAAGLTARGEAAQTAVYVLLGGVLVWIPVALFVVAGRRSRAWFSASEEWLTTHERAIVTVLLFLFGVLLIVDALSKLV
jgi:hypothetical protein